VLIVESAVQRTTSHGVHLVRIEAKKPDFRIVLYLVELVGTEKRRVQLQSICTIRQ